ncbi:unnamed protein product [Lampetra planeri]
MRTKGDSAWTPLLQRGPPPPCSTPRGEASAGKEIRHLIEVTGQPRGMQTGEVVGSPQQKAPGHTQQAH